MLHIFGNKSTSCKCSQSYNAIAQQFEATNHHKEANLAFFDVILLQLSMQEKDKTEHGAVVGKILSPTLTVEEKTDEEIYKEAFDHFDGNHSKTIPTSVSDQ